MILGITGAFGCGKSSVLHFFASENWHIFDADAVCRKFYDNKNTAVIAAVKEIFGSDVFAPDGSVDRKKIAGEAFVHPEKMQSLTDVMYPLLTEQLNSEINYCRKNKLNGAFEVPLLYEAGFETYFDAVLAVWAPEALRKERLHGRNFSDAEIERRNRMQIHADEKLERADFAIINTGNLDQLEQQLAELTGSLI
ncbi:MAG: dephospho-CoA kinase [Lentisphaeria bacterium]|nr:dephospho-CoA kinase [Lentisphaeria bacterium]